MKVAKAIDLYLDYHRLNSQKKIRTGLMGRSCQNSETNLLTETRNQSHLRKFFPFWWVSTMAANS